MLGQRIVTAVALLVLLIPALWVEQRVPFVLLSLALVGAAGWEWGRLNGLGRPGSLGLGLLVTVAGLLTHAVAPPDRLLTGLGVSAALLWVVCGPWALTRGVEGWRRTAMLPRIVLGVLILYAAWVALVEARARGLGFAMSVFCTVWVADIAAYAGGHAFGRRKLAPRISPGKTWEGALTGVLAVWLLGWGWTRLQQAWPALGESLFSAIGERFGPALGLALLTGVVAMSIVGDLFESLVKRAAGAKDSSGLLPGHGGVLDRIDALLPVFPLALALR
jgi:phosphatidate cytidylyltransferase